MKTAIQAACNEIVDELIDTIELTHLTKIIHIMHKHLETEKQQIIDAYNYGWQYGFLANSKELQPTKNSETYFSETYTTNKQTLK